MTAHVPASVYSDSYGNWGNVILGSQNYLTRLCRRSDKHKPSHLRSNCELNSTHCTDIEGEDTFWDPVSVHHCRTSDYGDYIMDTIIKHLMLMIDFKQSTQ